MNRFIRNLAGLVAVLVVGLSTLASSTETPVNSTNYDTTMANPVPLVPKHYWWARPGTITDFYMDGSVARDGTDLMSVSYVMELWLWTEEEGVVPVGEALAGSGRVDRADRAKWSITRNGVSAAYPTATNMTLTITFKFWDSFDDEWYTRELVVSVYTGQSVPTEG